MKTILLIAIASFSLTQITSAAIKYLGLSGDVSLSFNGTNITDEAYSGAPNSSPLGGDGGTGSQGERIWGSLGNGFLLASTNFTNMSGPEIFVYEAQSGLPEQEFRVLVSSVPTAFDDSEFFDITASLSKEYRTISDDNFNQSYIYSFDIDSFGEDVRRLKLVGTSVLPSGQNDFEGAGIEIDSLSVVSDSSFVIPEANMFGLSLTIGLATIILNRKR